MKTIRRSSERGRGDHGWLKSKHSFSFADYYDPAHMGFGPLRVINEDRVAPGRGFGTHPHDNMEILSYVISGELAHKDSMGNGRTIRAGELQAMSAGTGVHHSEFNPSQDTESHFLQIWIIPNEQGLTPSYAEWKPQEENQDGLILLASPDAHDRSVKIHQDARLYLGTTTSNWKREYPIGVGRKIWIQMITGDLNAGGKKLSAGDGLAVSDETVLELEGTDAKGSFLLFDLP